MPRALPSTVAVAVLVGALAACVGDDAPAATPSTSRTSRPPASSPPPSVAPTDAPTPTAVPTPEGSVLVRTDAGPGDVAVRRLAPDGTRVTGSWFGTSGGTDVVVVAVASTEGTAFSRDRAAWAWRRRPDLGGWLGAAIAAFPARDGVLGLEGQVADVTGDGDDDALLFALTGGTGACGGWSVVDLATDARVFARDLCDARVSPSSDPAGLLLEEAVYRPGDPHCCPSALRTTVLTYAGDGRWEVASRVRTPLA
ncbi:MAG TPA: hypothetical protein VF044_03410 [Actinomycetota bacterium]